LVSSHPTVTSRLQKEEQILQKNEGREKAEALLAVAMDGVAKWRTVSGLNR